MPVSAQLAGKRRGRADCSGPRAKDVMKIVLWTDLHHTDCGVGVPWLRSSIAVVPARCGAARYCALHRRLLARDGCTFRTERCSGLAFADLPAADTCGVHCFHGRARCQRTSRVIAQGRVASRNRPAQGQAKGRERHLDDVRDRGGIPGKMLEYDGSSGQVLRS